MKNEKEKKFEEVREIIAPNRFSILEKKKLQINKKTEQFSLKIPKAFAERAKLNKKTIAHIILKPEEEIIKEAIKSNLIIYFKEVESGNKKKETNKR